MITDTDEIKDRVETYMLLRDFQGKREYIPSPSSPDDTDKEETSQNPQRNTGGDEMSMRELRDEIDAMGDDDFILTFDIGSDTHG